MLILAIGVERIFMSDLLHPVTCNEILSLFISLFILEMANATVDIILQTSRDLLGKSLYLLHIAMFNTMLILLCCVYLFRYELKNDFVVLCTPIFIFQSPCLRPRCV